MSGPERDVPSAKAVEVVGDVRVLEYDPRWRSDFARLNIEWIELWFSLEAADLEVLDDPKGHVLANGGQVLFAVDENGSALGTVALVQLEDGRVEPTKMAVEPAAGVQRGRAVARESEAAA